MSLRISRVSAQQHILIDQRNAGMQAYGELTTVAALRAFTAVGTASGVVLLQMPEAGTAARLARLCLHNSVMVPKHVLWCLSHLRSGASRTIANLSFRKPCLIHMCQLCRTTRTFILGEAKTSEDEAVTNIAFNAQASSELLRPQSCYPCTLCGLQHASTAV